MKRRLQDKIAPRLVHPVEDLDPLVLRDIDQCLAPAIITTIEQSGPSGLPRLGQSPRLCQGVRIVPMKYTPASLVMGSSITTSPGRSALSRWLGWSCIWCMKEPRLPMRLPSTATFAPDRRPCPPPIDIRLVCFRHTDDDAARGRVIDREGPARGGPEPTCRQSASVGHAQKGRRVPQFRSSAIVSMFRAPSSAHLCDCALPGRTPTPEPRR
jgi:hypothetical protein